MDKFKQKAKQCATDALQLFDSEVNQGNSSGTFCLLWPSMEYKHFMTGPLGNSEFCFPETLNVPQGKTEGNIVVKGKQNSLFPNRPVIKCGKTKLSVFFLAANEKYTRQY